MKSVSSTVHLSPNALKVLEKRYLKKNEEGIVVEKAENLFRRIAKTIASADLKYGKSETETAVTEEEFYAMITSLDFLPNSPTLMNAGRRLGQLSACFVLPVEDSMESIFDAVKNTAIIHKSGGGTGFSFSNLRPGGDIVGSTKGISSGPISFMTVFDTATEAVKQGGTRRGANMGILRIDHPDILNFITAKDNNSKFNNFNLSIAVTDDFMHAVKNDKEYDLVNPRTKKIARSLRAKEVFDLIVNHAWKNGEPGIVFIDRINKYNPTPNAGAIESTNPCGEQPLLPYESCNLGSINLAQMVTDNSVDYQKLKRTVRKAVHFLDNVIDVNKYPIQKIDEITKSNRKIGLGVMGWADMLIQMGIPYNSDQAVQLAEEVMGFIQKEGKNASTALAEERGVFPNYTGSIYDGKIKIRNATVTTIAPTGTLSILASCSSGVEPLFAVSYVRTVMEGTKLIEVNPYFEKVAKERGFWSRDLMERIADKGSIHDFAEIPEDIKEIFVTAHDISPMEHITMQAAFQKHVDNAVSKTVNFSHDASPRDVEDVYMLAYNLDCKGVTVYRDGSREEQVLSTGKTKQEAEPAQTKIVPRKRPETIKGETRYMKTGCGTIYVTVNEDENGQLFELFTSMGKAGGCASSQAEAIGRLVSLALRSNIEPEAIFSQLKGITCHNQTWSSGGKITSCSDAIAKALEQYLHKGEKGNGNGKKHNSEVMLLGACPECGGAVEHEGGCAVCHNCGFTKCA
ncbi:MAG: ribonucleoside-diphosphate reductase, adenosylcobalamin-dependent [Nitrospirae bacterium GWC2_42_7]|nr:MAG: ribonucleoside-diphosphate reductase, adenosylcobalamin-dependent [Nitrospirae bacterium GWC2_42_7]